MKKVGLVVVISVLLLLLVTQTAGASPCCKGKVHVVRCGDTLFSIARRYGTTVQCLMQANPAIRNPNIIYKGQKLCIPTCCYKPKPKPKPCGVWYRVRKCNTLYSIARRFHARMWCIVGANGIRNPNRIYVGQWLWIPKYCRY